MKILSLLLALTLLPTLAFAQLDSATDANTPSVDQSPDDSCVQLTPGSYDFGDVPVGFSSLAKPFYLLNSCSANLIVTNVKFIGLSYSQTNNCTDGPIAPQTYCTIKTIFTPTFAGVHNRQLVVTDHKQDDNQSLQQSSALMGTGKHDMTITPTSCDFFVELGYEGYCTVNIKNNEPTRLTLNSCQASPNPPFSEETSCPSSLAKQGSKGDSAKITLEFWPYATGLYSGQFAVTTDSPEEEKNGNPYTIPLTGRAIQKCPPPTCN